MSADPSPQRGAASLAATAVLLPLFFVSGAAALVYEVAWFHLLRLAIGSSTISVAFLLGSFMGGMCLGSWLLPRCTKQSWHPVAVYGVLELGIGAFGLALPWLLPQLGRLYAEQHSTGTATLVWRGGIAAAGLLPPTILMGATLPAIARWYGSSREGLARLGWFYGSNVLGAVAGTALAGFWLLRVHDVQFASHVAATANGVLGVAALLASTRLRRARIQDGEVAPATSVSHRDRIAAATAAIALSGLTALGAEVVWTRQLSLLLGATTYSFSLILAVFLTGLGIGTSVGTRIARTSEGPRTWFGVFQLLLVPSMLWGAFAITHVVPFAEPTFVFQEHVYQNMPVHFAWDFARCALAMLPATVAWGASFPLALATAAGGGDSGRLVGGLYAANTIGAILGALGAGLHAIPEVGTQNATRVLVLLAGASALLLLGSEGVATAGARARRVLAATAVTALAAAGAGLVPAVPNGLIAFGRSIQDWEAPVDYQCVAEGVNASVAVSEIDGYQSFHVSGKVVASTQPMDMRLQRMLGHLPALVHVRPRSVLVVGCGAGVTAGCFVDHPSVERIVVCEIEPKVVAAARGYLANANHDVLRDPRTEVVIDDARHFLATTTETFDVITSDPIHPWVRGAAALYSAEYYELVKAHLRPGGVVTQWVPLYQTDAPAVKSQLGTFFRAFEHGSIWNSDPENKGYDLVALATLAPVHIDLDAVDDEIDRNPLLRGSLAEAQLGSAVALFSTWAGDEETLAPWLADAEINVDVSLRLQYLAGLSLDVYREGEIYAALRTKAAPAEGFFVGRRETVDELLVRLAR